jgi:glutathione peroxidase
MASSAHDFTVKTIDGSDKSLRDYAGQVLLVVNVASACGYTPQYAPLEQLHREYGTKGLRVLGFPCNDFGAQEPGNEAEIKSFCETSYGVSFDLFSKVKVKGDGTEPLFAWLQSDKAFGGPIPWNFSKFLVAKDGTIVARFPHKVDPSSKEVRAAIESALSS